MNGGIDWGKVRATVRGGATRAVKVLGKAQGFASIAAVMTKAPSPLSVLGATLTAAHLVGDLLQVSPADATKGWPRVDVHPSCTRIAFWALYEHLKQDDRNTQWHIGQLEGQGISAYAGYTNGGDMAWVIQAERDPAAVMRHIKAHVRANAGVHSALTFERDAVVVPAPVPESTPSDVADALWCRIEPALAAGHTRAVLLTGPPGTGKSTIARTLARRYVDGHPDATTMRIAVADFDKLRPSTVDGLLDIVRADVLLVDDLDRFANTDQLLDLFEHCHGRQRLVLATVNDEGRLPQALRRPGRIDEVVRVSGVGRDLALHILGATSSRLTEDQVCTTAGWPAAHVAELALRLTTIPNADPAAELTDVAERVRTNAT